MLTKQLGILLIHTNASKKIYQDLRKNFVVVEFVVARNQYANI